MTFYCCNYSDNNRYHLGQRRVSGNCACVHFIVCYISLCVFSYKQQTRNHLQFSSWGFHPLLQEFQVTGRAVSNLFLLAWLRLIAEAALFDCGHRLDVFTTVLASYRSNEIQIGTLSLWYWHFSRLHRASSALFIAVPPKLTYSGNGD